MSLPYLPLKERQAALGKVAPKVNWLTVACCIIKIWHRKNPQNLVFCLGRQEGRRRLDRSGKQAVRTTWRDEVRLSQRLTERLPQHKANSLKL